MIIGDKIIYDNEECIIKEIFKQESPSPSGDILLADNLGIEFLVHHNEIKQSYINGNICPWCNKKITKDEISNNETYVNGGEQTNGMLELWHKNCSEEANRYEEENYVRM